MAGIRTVDREPGDDDQNVLVARDGRYRLDLSRYKTAASYGRRKINFPKSLCKTMKRSLDLYPRTWMVSLLRSGKHPMSTTGLGHFCAASSIPSGSGHLSLVSCGCHTSTQTTLLWLTRPGWLTPCYIRLW